MLKNLNKAIHKTVAYGNGYGVMYRREEIFKRLISSQVYKKKSVLLQLTKNKKKVGEENNQYLDNKIFTAKQLANKLALIFDDILLIGITGSVAAGYPKKSDDIDLMIVVKKDKLWLTRLKIRLYVLINKVPHRKYGKQQKENEFCFNLWLDSDALLLPKNKRNLRNAMDLILMKPIVNKENTYQRFIINNSWAKKYVATGYWEIINNQIGKISNTDSVINKINIDKFTNWLAFWPQYLYMKTKIGNGLIDCKRAFFHPSSKK